jgi:hypothetical protein
MNDFNSNNTDPDLLITESNFIPGWEDLPDEVAGVASLQPIGAFEDSPAAGAGDPLPEFASLDEAILAVTGSILPTRNQGNAGTCVSFGTVAAIEYTMAVAIRRGKPFAWHAIATEPIYGGSRVEVGKGRLGRGDGSVGAWAAEFSRRWGVACRQNYPGVSIDLSQYSIPLSRQWGISGVPDSFEPILKQHPVQGIAQINTLDGLKRALANGYGVAESSGYLLRSTRSANGIIDAYRGGGHCMAVTGYIKIGKVDYFYIRNSWGDSAHTGPTHPKFPSKSGGLIHQSQMQSMLDGGDTWAFSDAIGFPARDICDWMV